MTPRPLGPLFDIAAQTSGELASLASKAGSPRDRLFAAFLAEIGAGRAGAATVAVMEDVHWADEATIDLLSYLGRRLSRARPWWWPPTGTTRSPTITRSGWSSATWPRSAAPGGCSCRR